LKNHGIIESCPSPLLSGIIGSPCISMIIEPDGSLELVGTFDKLNNNYFKNISAISPQKSSINLVILFFKIITYFIIKSFLIRELFLYIL